MYELLRKWRQHPHSKIANCAILEWGTPWSFHLLIPSRVHEGDKGYPFKLRLSGDFDFLVPSMSERVQRAPFGGRSTGLNRLCPLLLSRNVGSCSRASPQV